MLAYQLMVLGLRGIVLAFAAPLLWGCGTPNPPVVESTEKARPAHHRERGGALTEADKIRALLEQMRSSELVFVQDGQPRSGSEAAAALEHRLNRMASGIPTAHLFVERIGGGRPRATQPDAVRIGDGKELLMRDWLAHQLKAIEGKSPEQAAAKQPNADGEAAASNQPAGILDALRIVESSGLRFVAQPRKGPKGEPKGKRKEYSATEFSSMLRKKWEFLGKGVKDLDTFIEVIATDSLSSMEPYLVILGDGSEQEFRVWLLERIGSRGDEPIQAG